MHVHIDFETRSTVDIKASGADVYARHESTDALCLGYAIGDSRVEVWKRGEPPPLDLFFAIDDGAEVVAHNAAFELLIWNHTMQRHGWPPLNPEKTVCTMAMAYAMALPGALEKTAAALGIKHQKDMAGSRIMLQLSQPRKILEDGTVVWWTPEEHPEKYERLYAYCAQDILVEREAFKRMMQLSPKEKEIWLLDHKINQRGVYVDLQAVKAAIAIVQIEKARLDSEMKRITNNGVGTCMANGQLTDWLRFRGVKTEGVAKADVAALLEKGDLPVDCREALLLRQQAAKSSTAKLEAMLKGVCEDGRSRGLFQYHGASTGRWAGRRIQLQNLPRNTISQEDIEAVFEILRRVS